MKFPFPAFILAVSVLAVTAGCSTTDNTHEQNAEQMGPPSIAAPPTGPAVDVSALPKTTKIDGKTVTLKAMPSGVLYYDQKVGTGASPKVGQTVSVQYTGTLLDGTKFDSSYDHGGTPIDFPIGVGQVIKGWDDGVPSMKIGGKRRLVIPGDLAYGANPPTPTIPPNATLIFDIELVGIK